jgi:hypothetical protein
VQNGGVFSAGGDGITFRVSFILSNRRHEYEN